ncbi:tail fiber assembly protein [Pantoea piersonii]|uniref:tail fiber assembly protein n=1 Tax=Pantoea piersonii TaxID=2364647 RepID=UPI00289F7360|nr:tail fiber assembly protein [Pantoea piersonii]
MGNWALIKDGVVINTILWDGQELSPMAIDEGVLAIELKEDQAVSTGYSYGEGSFTPPQPTEEELQAQKQLMILNNTGKKESLMELAGNKIGVLQDAVDLEMATDEESAELPLWKKFRVLVSRIDANVSTEITWPDLPSS